MKTNAEAALVCILAIGAVAASGCEQSDLDRTRAVDQFAEVLADTEIRELLVADTEQVDEQPGSTPFSAFSAAIASLDSRSQETLSHVVKSAGFTSLDEFAATGDVVTCVYYAIDNPELLVEYDNMLSEIEVSLAEGAAANDRDVDAIAVEGRKELTVCRTEFESLSSSVSKHRELLQQYLGE